MQSAIQINDNASVPESKLQHDLLQSVDKGQNSSVSSSVCAREDDKMISDGGNTQEFLGASKNQKQIKYAENGLPIQEKENFSGCEIPGNSEASRGSSITLKDPPNNNGYLQPKNNPEKDISSSTSISTTTLPLHNQNSPIPLETEVFYIETSTLAKKRKMSPVCTDFMSLRKKKDGDELVEPTMSTKDAVNSLSMKNDDTMKKNDWNFSSTKTSWSSNYSVQSSWSTDINIWIDYDDPRNTMKPTSTFSTNFGTTNDETTTIPLDESDTMNETTMNPSMNETTQNLQEITPNSSQSKEIRNENEMKDVLMNTEENNVINIDTTVVDGNDKMDAEIQKSNINMELNENNIDNSMNENTPSESSNSPESSDSPPTPTLSQLLHNRIFPNDTNPPSWARNPTLELSPSLSTSSNTTTINTATITNNTPIGNETMYPPIQTNSSLSSEDEPISLNLNNTEQEDQDIYMNSDSNIEIPILTPNDIIDENEIPTNETILNTIENNEFTLSLPTNIYTITSPPKDFPTKFNWLFPAKPEFLIGYNTIKKHKNGKKWNNIESLKEFINHFTLMFIYEKRKNRPRIPKKITRQKSFSMLFLQFSNNTLFYLLPTLRNIYNNKHRNIRAPTNEKTNSDNITIEKRITTKDTTANYIQDEQDENITNTNNTISTTPSVLIYANVSTISIFSPPISFFLLFSIYNSTFHSLKQAHDINEIQNQNIYYNLSSNELIFHFFPTLIHLDTTQNKYLFLYLKMSISSQNTVVSPIKKAAYILIS
ncbi:hypothetical protein WA158_005983 [Blastocystis sp. Blastoise]